MKKVGGSAGLAALIKQRTELVKESQTTGQAPALPAIVAQAQAANRAANASPPPPTTSLPPPPPPPPTAAFQSLSVGSQPPPTQPPTIPPPVPPAAPPAAPAPPAPRSPPPAAPAPAPAPAAPPVTTYQPKVTTYNPSNRCCQCDKTVYKPEELLAIGKVYHAACFTCGGNKGDGCGRVLKRDGYLDHDSQPYCQACYNKQFRTKGFGYGNSLNTDFGQPAAPPAALLASRSTSPPVKPAGSASPKAAANPPPPAPVPSAPPTAAPRYTPTNQTAASAAAGSTAPKCTCCGKSVYKMEEVIAVGRVWHASCFTCGGTKGDGCRKTLTRDNYLDHENHPYCNACYSKLFRPKGFGYGNTLNTDYGPSPDNPSTSSGVVEGVGKAGDSFSKPKAPGRPAAPPAPKPAAPPAPSTGPAAPLIIPVTDGNEVAKGSVKIGGKAGELYKEASYQGDHDEVDESEW